MVRRWWLGHAVRTQSVCVGAWEAADAGRPRSGHGGGSGDTEQLALSEWVGQVPGVEERWVMGISRGLTKLCVTSCEFELWDAFSES